MTGRAMAARSGETGTGSTEGNSAVANGDGPQTTDNAETIMTDVQQAVPVAQEDREAAAQTIPDDGSHSSYMMVDAIMDGRGDDWPLVQAFARHRLDATQTREAELVAALTDARETFQQIAAALREHDAEGLAQVIAVAELTETGCVAALSPEDAA